MAKKIVQLECFGACETNHANKPIRTKQTIVSRIGRGFFIAQCTRCQEYTLARSTDYQIIAAQLIAPTIPHAILPCPYCETIEPLLILQKIPGNNGAVYVRALCCCGKESLFNLGEKRFLITIGSGTPLLDVQLAHH